MRSNSIKTTDKVMFGLTHALPHIRSHPPSFIIAVLHCNFFLSIIILTFSTYSSLLCHSIFMLTIYHLLFSSLFYYSFEYCHLPSYFNLHITLHCVTHTSHLLLFLICFKTLAQFENRHY